MSLWSALTGRNREQESDLYANYDKVDTVVDELNTIATKNVMSVRDEVCKSMEAINGVKGMEQYVGTINVSNFETAFDSVAETIKEIATTIQSKAEAIKTYEEASWQEKAASTIIMTTLKLGEGAITPFEEIGDAFVGLIGWLAPKDSGVEKWCSDFVEKDFARGMFDFYYKSKFADKSAITEDSIIANASLVLGKTGSLLGLMTITGPAVLGLSGLGSGIETGLKNGKDINNAFLQDGLIGAGAQMGLGMIGGKVGIVAGEAFNQYRNVNATKTAEEKAPGKEIKEAISDNEIFTPVTEPTTIAIKEISTDPIEDKNKKDNDAVKDHNVGESSSDSGNSGYSGSSTESESHSYKNEIPTVAPTTPKTVTPTVPKTNVPTTPPTIASTTAPTTPKTNAPTTPPTVPKTGDNSIENPPYSGKDNPSKDNGSEGTFNNSEDHSYTSGGEYGEIGFSADSTDNLNALDGSLVDGTTSISDILNGKSITKVKSNAPISEKSKLGIGTSKVIPIAAGITAAAAAGIGAKTYLDSRGTDDADEEDDEFEDVDWSDENGLEAQQYENQETDNIESNEDYELAEESNYYLEDENSSYKARNNNKLVEL